MALLQVGNTAPSFKGQNLTGPDFSLDSLKGKKSVVLVFAPDQISPAQANQTMSVYNKHRDSTEVVAFSRANLSVAMLKMFMQQFGIQFPVVLDPKQEIYKLYGVEKPVVLYSINKDGQITAVSELDPKTLNLAQVEEAIEKAK